jgi:DNA (cytosine-5)-methyltransferase 1
MFKGVNTTMDEGQTMVAHSLRADGFDASEDGTGRGIPLVADPITANEGKTYTHEGSNNFRLRNVVADAVVFQPRFARNGRGGPDDIASALTAEPGTTGKGDSAQVVAYGLRADAGREGKARTPSADAEGYVRLRDPGFNVYEEHAPTIDATSPHAVVDLRNSTMSDVAMSLQAGGIGDERGMSINSLPHVIDYAVRRLTPLECERLQGYPDGWTNIVYRGKPAKDGPRYKALGNAFPVPPVRWIGYRIQAVEDLGWMAEGGVFG